MVQGGECPVGLHELKLVLAADDVFALLQHAHEAHHQLNCVDVVLAC